jgi:hypothetical protein
MMYGSQSDTLKWVHGSQYWAFVSHVHTFELVDMGERFWLPFSSSLFLERMMSFFEGDMPMTGQFNQIQENL